MALFVGALFVPALFVAAPSAGAAAKGSAKPTVISKLAQIGHAAFWECPASTTELLIGVNTVRLEPGASLDISFTVHNGGTSSCTYTAPYAGVAPGTTSTRLTAGPCGSVGYEIEDSHHRDVWPGAQVINCPALGSARLAPGASVSGAGSWSQTWLGSTHRVPAGNYTLLVENGRFSFPLHVART